MEVACSADEAYVVHAAAMLQSLLAANGDESVRIHFLRPRDLSRSAQDSLTRMVAEAGGEVAFHDVDDRRLDDLPAWQYISSTMWGRIFLPEMLPEADRVLYLDVDTIVLDRLAPLWEVELGDGYVAAVTNVFQANHLQRPAELGMARPQSYFNSGVLLMNLDLMRRDDITARLIECAEREADRLEWPDQDVLNLVLSSHRVPLPPRWNTMNIMWTPQSAYVFAHDELDEARSRPAIRHFEGPGANKPWSYMCEAPYREAYIRSRAQTPWPDVDMQGRTARNVVERQLRRLRPSQRLSRRSRRD